MIYYFSSIVAFLLFTFLAGKAEGVEYRERFLPISQDEKGKLNTQWHHWQQAERIAGIGSGTLLTFSFLWNWIATIALLPMFAIVFWILYDGIYNAYKGEDFFHQSKQSKAWSEKFATKTNKIAALVVTGIVALGLLIYSLVR